MSVPIVAFPLFGVAKHLVRLGSFLEPGDRVLVIAVAVGVVLDRQLSVRAIDLCFGSGSRDAKYFVVAGLLGHDQSPFLAGPSRGRCGPNLSQNGSQAKINVGERPVGYHAGVRGRGRRGCRISETLSDDPFDGATFLILGVEVGYESLGGQQQARDAAGIRQRGAYHFDRVDHA